jgi:hypothetical protein
MTVYTDYSAIPADNNSPPPVGAPEGMYPSTVNDTMREMMSVVRQLGDQTETSFGGLGTMASQNANNVNITGGTLSVSSASIPTATFGTANITTANITTLNTSSGVNVPNVTATGTVHASGAISGSNVTATGNLSGSSITTTGNLSAAGISSSGNITASANMSATGNLEVDGSTYLNSLAIDSFDNWGWNFYRSGADGGHYESHTSDGQHYDRWLSAVRIWVGYSTTLMQLDGSGNLSVHGTVTPGGVLLDAPAGATNAKETLQTMLDSGKIDVGQALISLMQTVLDNG